VELRQIDCFLAVATDLHFGKAAKRLSLAQSSVSEAIHSLEKEVGGQLFVRTSRRVQLTPLGEKFRLGIEPAALVLRATLDDCRKTALGQTSRLRIGFLGGGLYEYTLPFVRHLRSKFHIDVDWVELSLLDQFEAVAVGKSMRPSAGCRFLTMDWCNARSCSRRRGSWSCLPITGCATETGSIRRNSRLRPCRHCRTPISWERGQRSISLTALPRGGRSREGQS
jgi:Bacterial regulatory helix-turn-helix protein, lysR family